jgi:membrane-associated phospholipid phosphatase
MAATVSAEYGSIEMGEKRTPPSAQEHKGGSFMYHSVIISDWSKWKSRWWRKICLEWPCILFLIIVATVLEVYVKPHRQCVPGLSNSNCGNSESPDYLKPLRSELITTTTLMLIVVLVPVSIFGTSTIWLHHFKHRGSGSNNNRTSPPNNASADITMKGDHCCGVGDVSNDEAIFEYFFQSPDFFKKSDGDLDWRQRSNSQLNSNLTWVQFERLLRLYFVAIAMTVILTDTIKLFVGAPRPNFYFVQNEKTTDPNDWEKHHDEIRKSFPSGHSSVIWCAMIIIFLTFRQCHKAAQARAHFSSSLCQAHYEVSPNSVMSLSTVAPKEVLMHQGQASPLDDSAFAAFQIRGNFHYLNFWWFDLFNQVRNSTALSICITSLPLFVAVFVSCTRIIDYWHHPVDVLAGSILGSAVGMWVHSVHQMEFLTPFRLHSP